MNAYAKIVNDNIARLYQRLPPDLAQALPAEARGQRFSFSAFGSPCVISPAGIELDGQPQTGVLGILISLYALNASTASMQVMPLRAFKELPDSMPYAAAFSSHTEQVLVAHVARIAKQFAAIGRRLDGPPTPEAPAGDFSIQVRPLPKITLHYIFYLADEDFPAAATCLYSHNARAFLPVDALADVGEYTSKTIVKLLDAA